MERSAKQGFSGWTAAYVVFGLLTLSLASAGGAALADEMGLAWLIGAAVGSGVVGALFLSANRAGVVQ